MNPAATPALASRRRRLLCQAGIGCIGCIEADVRRALGA